MRAVSNNRKQTDICGAKVELSKRLIVMMMMMTKPILRTWENANDVRMHLFFDN